MYSTDVCAIDYEKRNTLGKNQVIKCIIKINYIVCAHGPESFAKGNFFWHKDSFALTIYFHISARQFLAFSLYPQKKSLEVIFPVVISSMEDLSNDRGLQKYYPFNRDSEEVHTPSMCLVYHLIWSSYATGEWWCFL